MRPAVFIGVHRRAHHLTNIGADGNEINNKPKRGKVLKYMYFNESIEAALKVLKINNEEWLSNVQQMLLGKMCCIPIGFWKYFVSICFWHLSLQLTNKSKWWWCFKSISYDNHTLVIAFA